MAVLIAFLLSAALFAGFLFLTAREARTGSRMFPGLRASLDERATRLSAAINHMHVGAFIAQFLKDTWHRLVHDVAHVSLAGVQALESLLRRSVARLRARRVSGGTPRKFVEHMSNVKRELRAPKEEVREVE